MRDAGVITGVRVSHESASIEEIESASTDDAETVVECLLSRDGVEEAFAIQTCNRAEAYVVTDAVAVGRRALDDFAPDVRDGSVVEMDHEQSLRHLMRVAAGLESLVLGEDQILGQLKRAAESAREAGAVGPVLDDALTKAVHVGERARTETRINEGAVSLGSAAVKLAASEVDVAGATALVVGAGEMGRLAAEALAAADVEEVVVANRTLSNAEHLAELVDSPARAVPLDDVDEAVAEAEVVITATGSPTYVISEPEVAGAGETMLIDIAQPRDVDPAAGEASGVVVRDIDALEAVTDETRALREEAARRVEAMIDDEFDRLLDSYKRKRADEAIGAMYESAERVKEREVQTALSKLESQGTLTPEQRETVASMADALVGQLLSAPTKSLRDAAAEDDWSTIQTAMRLFNPDFEGEMPHFSGDDGESGESSEGRPDGMPADVNPSPDDDIPQRVLESLSDD
ncbi:glutamyl-tRNA reductase [Halopelagius longus]|uniref:Glutamyl-tRNA reductase n=1 Tax=Halopelagius longus TaxID=1236180 RepID=A0A1H0Y8D3_9EURY|nr:glutamyl-tRNA reductase [Halopelagius longus]RDI72338.1 glutamyl-tRNA reductase [Halopelagius longus]SDQ11398.1 glutamyl-tRNA reductase [Halopelagius longus]